MMEKKAFIDNMTFLASVYRNFDLSEQMLDAWYECLKDLTQEDTFTDSVHEWVKMNKYPPTIADLRSLYMDNKHEELWQ